MLAKYSDYVKKTDNLKVIHRGRVVSNGDSKKLGRIKCQVKGVFETTNTNSLPWVHPVIFQMGVKPDSMNFQVPEVGSEVIVLFPYGDVYSPFYIGGSISELTQTPGVFDDDYPNTEGWINSIPMFFRVNKTQKTIDLYNDGNKFTVRVDADGNLLINVPKSLIINVGQDYQIKIGGNKAVKVALNSVEDVGAIKETKASSIGEVAAIISNEGACMHSTGVVLGQVAAQVAQLEAKIAELEAKVSEFGSLASTAKSISDFNKANIAKVD